jgi:CO/xanthine dehydrogenase FAD-binding subunit
VASVNPGHIALFGALQEVCTRECPAWIGAADERIAIGAATEIPMRLTQTEASFAGRRIDEALLREAGK